MRTYIYKIYFSIVLLLISSFSFNSCNKENLDLEPYSVTESSYYKNDAQFLKAIIGVYAKLDLIYWFNNNNPCHHLWLLPGDDLTSAGTYNSESFTGLISSDDRLNDLWTAYYQVINRANVILLKINEAPSDASVSVTEETTNHIKGEALFLRALMYYSLWNLWGTAPLVNERITSLSATNTPSSKDTELLDQAITDLTEAAELLPANWSTEFTGRATNESAYGLLGKCLCFRADYHFKTDIASAKSDLETAISAFNKITSKSLVSNYGDNFNYASENNQESLFEFQASVQAGFENIWLSNDFGLAVGSMHAYWGFFNCEWSFWAQTPFVPTQKLINAFEPGDPRIAYTFEATTSSSYPSGYRWLKYVLNEGTENMTGSLNNPRILRYADVLLLKSEAILKSGGSKSDAIELINQVRTRARGEGAVPADLATTETDENVIMKWIMDERFRELSGEENHRWFDLKRWSYAGFIDISNWDSGVTGFSSLRTDFVFPAFFTKTKGKLWYPIPSHELDRNTNIEQNPGY